MNIVTLAKRAGPFIAFFLLTSAALLPCIGVALTTDQQRVIHVTASAVHSRFPKTSAIPNVSEIAIVGRYALTTWTFGQGGGQAVLQKNDSGAWLVLGIGGGEMDASTLVSLGVPSKTATSLERALGPVQTSIPKRARGVSAARCLDVMGLL